MNIAPDAAQTRRLAWRFILLVGITNLFADMTYEGARGVNAEHRRSTAFGYFDTIYGVAWLAGSVALGFLYDHFIWGLVALPMVAQLAAIPVFFAGARKKYSS